MDQRISSLEKRLAEVRSTVNALRQSINPAKPEEVLTIARMQDEIKEIDKNLSDLKESVTNKQQAFEDSIRRETSTTNQSTTLILVVLIPLVLNFMYTAWKDLRAEKKNPKRASNY